MPGYTSNNQNWEESVLLANIEVPLFLYAKSMFAGLAWSLWSCKIYKHTFFSIAILLK